MHVNFEWDPAKAASNLRKHCVSFELALRVFADPFALMARDRIEGGELRWQTVGMVDGHFLLLVVHTLQDEGDDGESADIVRIISARAADRKERRRYEQESR